MDFTIWDNDPTSASALGPGHVSTNSLSSHAHKTSSSQEWLEINSASSSKKRKIYSILPPHSPDDRASQHRKMDHTLPGNSPEWQHDIAPPLNSPGAAIVAQKYRSIQNNSHWELFDKNLEHALQFVKTRCICCLFIKNRESADHSAPDCPLAESNRELRIKDVINSFRCPPNSGMCYGCLLWLKKFPHKCGRNSLFCPFPNILPPLLWLVWGDENIRRSVMEHFQPRSQAGSPIGSHGDMIEWLLTPPKANQYPMIFQVFLWLYMTSNWNTLPPQVSL
jgi:hypothetical protein